MGKSIYEQYAIEEQPKKLASLSMLTLREVIDYINRCKKVYSALIIDGMICAAAFAYGVSETEIEALVAGSEHWIL